MSFYRFCRILLLLAVPFVLMILEIWHPIGFKHDVFDNLLTQLDWWMTLNMIQLPLLALIGTGIYVLISGLNSLPAIISRVATWIYVIYYTIFMSINGIGIGVLIRNAKELTPSEQAPIAHAIQLLFNNGIFGGSHSLISEFASIACLIGITSAAWALYLDHRPFFPVILLLAAGFFLWNSHAFPSGPIAFACLFVANCWLEFSLYFPTKIVQKKKAVISGPWK